MRAASVLVDFDGTACPADVFIELAAGFVGEDWERHFGAASWNGNASHRQDITRLARLLRAKVDDMLAFVLDRVSVDPAFLSFVQWARAESTDVAIVSDGLGFYIRPMLDAVGLSDVPVMCNIFIDSPDGGTLRHPFENPSCRGCGICKKLVVESYQRRRRPVAFVGDGNSDRYAAHYADIVFAKRDLARTCMAEEVPFIAWHSFDDIRHGLAKPLLVRRSPAPDVCPGWVPSPSARRSARLALSPDIDPRRPNDPHERGFVPTLGEDC
jgi:2-hydroxy-3-keto-5-methylthiopentenyl-1-phosphate phosphatase